MTELRLVVNGAGGRMGRNLVRAIDAADGVTLVGAVERPGAPTLGQDAGVLAGLPALGVPVLDEAAPLLAKADAVLDFTTPEASLACAERAAAAGIVHVIGSTGWTAQMEAALKPAAQKAVLIKSGNMSMGVNLLLALVRRTAATLGPDFDIEIVETHHRMKVDAPSGTALMLGAAAAEGRGITLADHSVRGRDGVTGARRLGDVGFAALRGGTVVGEHDVVFAGPYERVILTHRAEDRMIFARGAVRAAQWGFGKPPGLYSMVDVLGLDD